MMWESGGAGDYGALNSEDSDSQDEEIQELDESEGDDICTHLREETEDSSNIQKSFHFLEECSFIDFIDTNGDLIITAGRDHDIKVWDAEKEVVIRRLIGHTGPITGIKLQGADSSEASSADLTVISSSEDGSIREWSLQKGMEKRKIETENVITCMGVISNKLTATGNHKGHLDVHHLSSGQLYCSIVAHNDPIDALMVNEMYICTVVYDRPGSLRIWLLKWGKMICMYSLEELFSIEFTAFTMHGDLLILGDGTKQELHILNYMTNDTPDTLQLDENAGHVQQVEVMDGLVLASTIDINKMVRFHVYQLVDFDHLGTFYCKNMERISSIILIRNRALKFILGGSALAVLKLETLPSKNITSTDSSSKYLKKGVENTTIQESKDSKDNHHPENELSKDLNANETPSSQSSNSGTPFQNHQKQPTFESFAHLPPIIKTKEPKSHLKKADLQCKQSENEYYLERNAHASNSEGMLPYYLLKANFQQKTRDESTVPIDELNRLGLGPSNDQGDSQQSNEIHQEEMQKVDSIELSLDKNFIGETSGNSGTEERSVPRTLTHKQKYKSEEIGVIKLDKSQGEGKKHNWFNTTKKKQNKCTKKAQKKEKDCKIM